MPNSAPFLCEPATAEVVQHPMLQSLLAAWRAAATPLPDRGFVDPVPLGPWLGHLLLIEPTGGDQFRYRLYGTGFVSAFGRELTGHDLAELPQEQFELLQQDYVRTLEARVPMVRRHRARFPVPMPGGARPSGDVLETWERLVLPIADEHGAIDLLLVAAYPLTPD
jgi:hypothetical protein